jgi:hypothetical protein
VKVRGVAVLVALFAAAASAGADELVTTVATSRPRVQLSAFLVASAENAAQAGNLARAIPFYQALAVARGPASPEQKRLAELWTLAGQNSDAADAWSAYAAAVQDPAAAQSARTQAQQLASSPDPFAAKLALTPIVAEARRAFALGRAAFDKRAYGDALIYFHMGYALAPELPGFPRELGATYERLGEPGQKREFYRRYLVERPFGPNADVVRAELAKDKDLLGTLLVSSSLPCSEIWLNRQRITSKLPDHGLAVAPGQYKGLCFQPSYEMALFEYTTVEPGKPAAMTFRWAIVVNALEHPLGRIAVENPHAPGTMIDLGITSLEVGVAVPADGHKLRMVLKDDTGTRSEERQLQLEPGQRIVIRW